MMNGEKSYNIRSLLQKIITSQALSLRLSKPMGQQLGTVRNDLPKSDES
jgi:hypothetical protein